uniref:Uncharacterized protein n=2 Tax=Picea TaxID=3328 RepID=A0A101M1R6_PICGL|nr:hypothetical protein ABT39_MTgene3839 [Picea glauca]QHR90173.1 hypothetical protein Q903MT_gene4196 [Picea sitchensis]
MTSSSSSELVRRTVLSPSRNYRYLSLLETSYVNLLETSYMNLLESSAQRKRLCPRTKGEFLLLTCSPIPPLELTRKISCLNLVLPLFQGEGRSLIAY